MEEQMSMIDSAFSSLCSGSKERGVTPATDMANVYGVPLPYFSQRALFQSNVIPAGKFFLLAGVPGSCKTSLALYFSRLFVEAAGMALAIHTENKWPDVLPKGIMAEAWKRLAVYQPDSMQEWMNFMKDVIREKLAKLPGWNRIPAYIFVDSLQGSTGKEHAKIIDKTGSLGRQFSETARELTQFLPRCGSWLADTSASVFLLHHLKTGEEGELYGPGGVGKDFYSSMTFYIDRSSQKSQAIDVDGRIDFHMTCIKNSFGPSSKYGLKYAMEWKWEDGEQVFRFNWPEATTEALYRFLTDQENIALPKKHPLRDVCGEIEKAAGGSKGSVYTCAKLGATKLTACEFGEAVEQDAKFRKELDLVCHVIQRPTTAEWFAKLDAEAALAEEAKSKGKKKAKE